MEAITEKYNRLNDKIQKQSLYMALFSLLFISLGQILPEVYRYLINLK